MTLGVVVNGTLFTRAKSISVSRSIRSLSGWFDISSSADDLGRLPIRVNDSVQIVAGTSDVLLTGFVERLGVRQDAGAHEIRIGGRDITADLIDSTLRTKVFNGPIGFQQLVTNVLREQGLSSIRVVNEAGQLKEISGSELVSGEIGESAFAFLERYARRVQVILTTNEDGNVLIMRAGAIESGVGLIREDNSPLTNVLASSVEVNVAGRFGSYACQGQLAPAGADFDGSTNEATAQSGTARDRNIRSTRFFEFEAETAMDSDACGDRAKLEGNVRRAKSLDYQATVQGVPAQLKLNRRIRVRDDFCNINDTLLITDVEHRFDLGGTTTTVGCTYRDAFTLEEELELATAARSEAGEDFTLDLDALR